MNRSRPQPLPAWQRIPPFLPVPLRARADGWTPLRQAEFIGFLAESGCVATAAGRAGRSRASAYRLRGLPGAASFAAAWDAACGKVTPARKLTFDELQAWAEPGPFVVRFRGGRYCGVSRKVNDSALLRLLGQVGRGRMQAEDAGW